jgi:hypothetical protein
MKMSTQQQQAMKLIVQAVMEAVRAAGPTGAPGGVLYSALMVYGCTLAQFEGLMSALQSAGLIRLDGDCYHLAAQTFSGVRSCSA